MHPLSKQISCVASATVAATESIKSYRFTFLMRDEIRSLSLPGYMYVYTLPQHTENLLWPETPERERDFCHIDFQFSCINISLQEFTEVCI